MIYTDENITFFLKSILEYKKEKDIITERFVCKISDTRFPEYNSGNFVSYLIKNNFIHFNNQNSSAEITKKGYRLIRKQTIKSFTSHPLIVFIIIFSTLIITILAYAKTCKPVTQKKTHQTTQDKNK